MQSILKQAIKNLVKKLVSNLSERNRKSIINVFVKSLPAPEQWKFSQYGVINYFSYLKANGWKPQTFIDVGAFEGNWTAEMMSLNPEGNFYCFEPLQEKVLILKKKFEGKKVVITEGLLGPSAQDKVKFHASESGSSVYAEQSSFSKELRELKMSTLDESMKENSLQKPVLLKLDVQGYELEVLKGAKGVLAEVDIVQMEVSLLDYNEGAPLIAEVLQEMNDAGFYAFEIPGFHRRADDWSLIQVDIIFCRKEFPLRQKANNFFTDFKVVNFG